MVDAHFQLEKDSHKKSLKSQSCLCSCCSLAPQGDSQLIKWAKDLPWTKWRSIYTPQQVQGPANHFTLKMGAPDAVDVAPDALHRASGDTQRPTVLVSDRAQGATSERPVTPTGVRVNVTPSLSLEPDATQ